MEKEKGEIYKVIVEGNERIIKVVEIPEVFSGHIILVRDLFTQEIDFLKVDEITPIKKLSEKEAIKMISKKIDIFKAINLIKKLTQEDGGVLSHENSMALPCPNAESLLALYELSKLYPEKNFLPKDELEKRVEWLANLREWKDWEGHKFNCFAASNCVWVLALIHDSISSEELRKKIIHSINQVSLKIIESFDEEEQGWSWSKEVKPTYPFYTSFALKALKEAEKFLSSEILTKAEKVKKEAVKGLKKYLKSEGDFANTAMAIWGIYEILGEKINDEKYLSRIFLE